MITGTKLKGTEAQRHKSTKAQKHKSTKAQKHKSTKAQRECNIKITNIWNKSQLCRSGALLLCHFKSKDC
jgi:hypothetical protein